MKAVLIYWIIGCVIVGAGAGLHGKRCPNDEISMATFLAEAAAWPGVFVRAMINPALRTCKRPSDIH